MAGLHFVWSITTQLHLELTRWLILAATLSNKLVQSLSYLYLV